MNERLATFRQRLRSGGRKPERMKFKEWWSVGLSTLAFLISATGFYLNSLEKTEELSAALYELPEVKIQDDEKFALEGKMRVAFINSGNQYAAIMGLYVTAEKLCIIQFSHGLLNGPVPEPCYDAAGHGIYKLSEEGFVVKPGEIVVKEIQVSPPEERLRAMDSIKSLELEFAFYFITPSMNKGIFQAPILVSSGFTDFPIDLKSGKNAELRPVVIRSRTNNFLKAWWNDRRSMPAAK